MRHDEALFSKPISKPISNLLVPKDAEVIFVSDAFPEQLIGGAELTLQALIDTAPVKTHKILASQLTVEHLKQGAQKFWVFGNYASLDPRLFAVIAANCRFSIVECDYKFCKHRSVEKHLEVEGSPCDCDKGPIGGAISGFMSAADHVWWMSEKQRDLYHARFPYLVDYPQSVLSSVFNDKFFRDIATLRSEVKKGDRWLVLEAQSWIKGSDAARKLADERGLEYDSLGCVPYDVMLKALAVAKGLVYTPVGGDTCPRLVIEAKLLGCELILNENVQHANESWFDTDDLESVEEYLRGSAAVFWRDVRKHVTRDYTLSGYATTFNCVKQEYPYMACIESMLAFCDEVVVVDAGSTDGTLEALRELQKRPECDKLFVHVVERDWADPRSALFDGMQKAEARRRCTGDFVWQMDVDEVVRVEDCAKIRELTQNFPKAVPMISLPVVEFWGGLEKIRMDINPQKWRLSRNSPRITHGIPGHLIVKDNMGADSSCKTPVSDGCDPIDINTQEPIIHLGFLTKEMMDIRELAVNGDQKAHAQYEAWFEKIVTNLPSVWHYSWIDIARKIKLYSTKTGNFGWAAHWEKLVGHEYVDSAEKNAFFDKPWAEVTEEDIKIRAKELAEKTGGHIFHQKWLGTVTPWMTLKNVKRP